MPNTDVYFKMKSCFDIRDKELKQNLIEHAGYVEIGDILVQKTSDNIIFIRRADELIRITI